MPSSHALHAGFEERQEADYQDLADVSEEGARASHGRAAGFVARVRQYLGGLESGADRPPGDINRPPAGR